jgi:outer membrane protein TolC
LLRNFGLNFAYLLVNVTQLNSEAAAWTYRAQLADFVKQVISAYWVVVFTRQNLAVQQQSLALAQQTLRENNERVRVGLLAPVAVKEAESEAASREQQVIVASNLLDNALRTLQQIIYLQKGDAFIPRPIEPIDEPRTTPVTVDANAALNLALEQRPEVHAQTFDLQSKQLTARVRENQLLPRLDAVGSFGLNGLSGDAVTVLVDGQQVQTPFDGPYSEALDRLTSKDFYSYRAGVELEIPIGNAAAKSEYAKAKIDVSQSELNRRQLFSDISLQVSTAVNDVVANMKRIQSSRVARELAEENLRNQQKRLEVGIATTKDVLDFQDDLTQARGVELRAATDYNISLAELARAQGTLLDQYSVVVEVPGKRFVPWWARF